MKKLISSLLTQVGITEVVEPVSYQCDDPDCDEEIAFPARICPLGHVQGTVFLAVVPPLEKAPRRGCTEFLKLMVDIVRLDLRELSQSPGRVALGLAMVLLILGLAFTALSEIGEARGEITPSLTDAEVVRQVQAWQFDSATKVSILRRAADCFCVTQSYVTVTFEADGRLWQAGFEKAGDHLKIRWVAEVKDLVAV